MPASRQSKGFDGLDYEAFRVYPQEGSEPDSIKSLKAPPEALVRVVTKFDDFEAVV